MNFEDLMGKTISSVQQLHPINKDDNGFLKLTFTDDSECFIVANYGFYTGKSLGEYPTTIGIKSKEDKISDDNISMGSLVPCDFQNKCGNFWKC